MGSEGAIQRVEEQGLATAQHVRWTRDMVELCRRVICPKGISPDEFTLFIEQCKATGFNPMTKEAYCVPRRVNIAPTGAPKEYVMMHVFQSSVDGMRARAGRFATFHSSSSQAVYENDYCEVDEEQGLVKHRFQPNKPRGRIMGAWGKVAYKSGPPVVVWLPVTARTGGSDFWRNDPGGMLAKCAEAAALRKAFPVQMSGVHAQEELRDEPEPSRLDAALGGASETGSTPAQLSAVGALVEFGIWKGRPISGLSPTEASAAIDYANEKLAENPSAKWAKRMRDNMALIMAHVESATAAAAKQDDAVDAEIVSSEPTEEEKAAILAAELEAE